MNLSNLITEAQRLAGRVDIGFTDRCRRWINEAQDQWAISVPWSTLNRIETFAMDGTQNLVLPPRVLTVKWILDRTNKNPIRPNDHMDVEYPASTVDATPGAAQSWRELGVQAVSRQPAAAGFVAVTTTASDTFSVYVAGLAEMTAASGTAEQYYPAHETIVVSSTGTATGTVAFVRVDVVGKDDFTNGDVLVRDASANLLTRIPAHAYQNEYRLLQFVFVPPAGTQFDIQYVQRPPPLIDNAQQPPPAVETDYLIWYCAAMMHGAQAGQEQEAQVKRARADEILARRVNKNKKAGDKDWRAFPAAEYWSHEWLDETPNNGGVYGW